MEKLDKIFYYNWEFKVLFRCRQCKFSMYESVAKLPCGEVTVAKLPCGEVTGNHMKWPNLYMPPISLKLEQCCARHCNSGPFLLYCFSFVLEKQLQNLVINWYYRVQKLLCIHKCMQVYFRFELSKFVISHIVVYKLNVSIDSIPTVQFSV